MCAFSEIEHAPLGSVASSYEANPLKRHRAPLLRSEHCGCLFLSFRRSRRL